MSFRAWVRSHAGQSVHVEWENHLRAPGRAQVVLLGFDEAAEQEYPGGVLLALLEQLDGTNRTGLLHTADGRVPVKTLIARIDGLRRERPGGEIVWISGPHLKRAQAAQGDLVVCSVYDDFVVDDDEPDHAQHGALACALHDEPIWHHGRWPR